MPSVQLQSFVVFHTQRHIVIKPTSDIFSTVASVSMLNNLYLSSLLLGKRQVLTMIVCRFVVPSVKHVGENSLFPAFKKFLCYEIIQVVLLTNRFANNHGPVVRSMVSATAQGVGLIKFFWLIKITFFFTLVNQACLLQMKVHFITLCQICGSLRKRSRILICPFGSFRSISSHFRRLKFQPP